MKIYLRIPVFFILFLSVFFLSAQTPFSKGVNLTNWFQTGSAREIQFSKYTKEDFIRIKALGCDVIRLPINLHFMTNGAPDYTLDPLFLDLLDQAVDWAEELEIHLILDNHTFDPNDDTTPQVEAILLKVWPQMAGHFKDRSDLLLYEVLNEPHGIDNTLWCAIQGRVIDAIRAIDTKHTIVVGPSEYNSYNELKNMPVYTDTNLLYTFHFYDPFMFTHQGATWTNGMQDVSGVPFPYVASKMPATPASAVKWVADALGNYRNDGTVARVKQWLDIAVNFKTTRNVNLFCGEFGVYIPNSPHADRIYWYEVVRKYLNEKGISWTTWDYQGGFGLFEKGTSELFEYDLDTALLRSLDFNIPEQKDFVSTPETEPFSIYTDYIGSSIFSAGSAGVGGTLDFFSTDEPQAGNYSIFWTGSPQYSGPAFDLKPDMDLSHMVTKNYELDFWVRGDTPGTRFEIRFVDSKTTVEGDHPWRISYTLDQTKVTWDGTWQHVKIPLKSFRETGSWDNNAWFGAAGKYDWRAVDRLEIIAEFGALGTQKIWFDEMQINGVPFTSTEDQLGLNPFNASLFPNPLTENTILQYDLPEPGLVNLGIYDLSGKKLATLIDKFQSQGRYQVSLNEGPAGISTLTAGVYVCKIISSGKTAALKLVVKR